MMTIDEEVRRLEDFLSHSCGFEVSVYAMLQIRPIDEGCPPRDWEVFWIERHDDIEFESYKEFSSLHDACQYFVEKRRYLCLGTDFEAELMKEVTNE
jgi:hypothetical protein